MNIKPSKANDYTVAEGVASIRKLLDITSDQVAAAALPKRTWLTIAQYYGYTEDRSREVEIVEYVRSKLFIQCCTNSGLRWVKANKGQAISVYIDQSLSSDFRRWIMQSAGKWLAAVAPTIRLEFTEGTTVPDIYFRGNTIDGRGGVLAQVWSKASDPNDDIEFEDSQSPSVLCEIDLQDTWFEAKFLTVMEHEWGHIFGIDHLPFGNKLYEAYTGPNYEADLGPQDLEEITMRHGASN